MIKRFINIFLLICILACASSCSRSPTSKDYLHATGSFAIPGMNQTDARGMKLTRKALENDDYGRVLFKYTTYNEIFEKDVDAYVIMQKHGEDSGGYYICFYEDICYSLSCETESDVLDLKALNDWDQPLYTNKMAKRYFSMTYSGIINDENTLSLDIWKIRDKIESSLQVDSSIVDSFDFVDDGNGKVVCTVLLKNSEKQEVYFAITDKSYEIKYVKINDLNEYPQVYAKFKQDNGWNYGN